MSKTKSMQPDDMEKSKYPGFTDRQWLAFLKYIDGGTVTAAAKAAETSRGRIYEWMNTDHWRAAQAEVSKAVTEQIKDRITNAMGFAIDGLVEVMQTPGPFSHNVVSAASRIFDTFHRLYPIPTPETPGANAPVAFNVYLPEKGSITFEPAPIPEPPAENEDAA